MHPPATPATRRTEIIAHRGGAALWPENSEPAFRGARALGVDQIEFDVQLTADGVPVIFHDGTLERMTDGRGPLAERTLEELERLEIRDGGGRIQTLEGGLDLLADFPFALRCEFKADHRLVPYPGIVERVVACFEARGLLPRAVFTSFHLPTLETLLALERPIRDATWLVTRQMMRLLGVDAVIALARHAGVGSVGMDQAFIDERSLERLHEAGLGVGAFGVHEDETVERVLCLGVDAFTSDRPDVALALRERFEAHRESVGSGDAPSA